MSSWLLSLIAIATIGLSVIAGYRRGFRRQIPRLLAFLFGAVCAHIFAIPVENYLREAWPDRIGITETVFIYTTLSRGFLFIVVYIVIVYTTGFLGRLLARPESGVINGISGALLSLLIWLTFLSLSYNFMICMSPRSALTKSLQDTDGNIIQEVLYIAPVFIGSQDPDTLSHLQQLEDAGRIS